MGSEPVEEAPEQDAGEWEPLMSPSQRDFYYDSRLYVLGHGERGSGKTLAALHKDVRHCYLYNEALVLLVCITRSSGQLGGAWYDLTNHSTFIEGPLAGTPAGILNMWRDGIGLEWGNFTTGNGTLWSPYQDTSKNMWVDVRNQHGGISRICFKSMPAASLVIDRIKDVKPSMFHFEELTNVHDALFFTQVIQQLGRHRSVPSEAQQYIATCNPALTGQAHWVFKTWFVDPHVIAPGSEEKLDSHTFDFPADIIEMHPDYGVHHIKMTENTFMPKKEAYLNRIIETARRDPTEYNRAILGQWIPRASGDNLLAEYYDREIHMRGDTRHGLEPVPGEPIIIGYDPGNVNNARILMQLNHIKGMQPVWRVFDELVTKRKKVHFEVLVRDLLERMYFWCERYDHPFAFYHISDRQALTHWNPHGSYEKREYEKISKRLIEASDRYKKYLSPIRMLAPDKGPDSVAERVRLVKDMLLSERLYVSAQCAEVNAMFQGLRKAKDRQQMGLDDKPMKAFDGFIHTFDALSYPMYYFAAREPKVKAQNNQLALVGIGVR